MKNQWQLSYDTEVPLTIEPTETSLFELIQKRAESYPESISFICLNKKINATRFLNLTNSIANSLSYCNIKKGDCIAVLLPNIIQFPAFNLTPKLPG